MLRITLRLCLASVLFAGVVLAQTVSSSVTGVLLDSSGAALVGVECALMNEATGVVHSARSSADGGFTFPNVLAGTYTFTARLAGFKTLETKNINVTSGETRALGRLSMQLGDVVESVSVISEGASVQLSSSEKSGLITGTQLNDIAVRGRDFFTYLATIPGVVDNFSQRRETTSPDSIRGTFINGGRENQKNMTVDGVTTLDVGSNSTVHYQPNMDSISEIKVMTTNYQAEFGRNGAGVITVITKGGGRDFHGSGYWFYRHEGLNANSFFNNRTGTRKAPYRYRINGYSIGGPAYIPGKFNTNRDKLFFFWSQEYVGMRRDYGTRFVNMPTALERQGDFSRSFDTNGALIPVRDPITRQTYPGNIIPPSLFNKLGQDILNFYPLPNYTDPDPNLVHSRNFRSQYSGAYPKRQDMIRIDANPSSSLQFYYRFVKDKDEQDTPYGMWVNGGINYFLTPVRFGQPGKGHVVRLNKIFSPTLINEFTFGKSFNRLYFDPVDTDLVDRSKMGNPKQWFADSDIDANYIPNVTFGGQPANTVNSGFGNIPYVNYNDVYSVVNNLSKVWRNHSLKAGIYVERTNKYQVGGGNWRGTLNFSRNVNNPYDSNNSYSNALLGQLNSYGEATARVNGDWWFWNVEWYLQDNWRVNNRLTIDLGMRFYHLPPWTDNNKTMAAFDPGLYNRANVPPLYFPARNALNQRVAKNPLTGEFAPAPLIGLFVPGVGDPATGMAVGGENGYPEGLYTVPKIAFGPRLGLAYDLTGTGKTALRAGFGMFQDRMQGNPSMNTNGNPPVTFSPTLYFGDLATYADNPGVIGPSGLNSLLGYNRLSSTMNYSFGLQHQVWNTVIDASYVGSLSRHLMASRNINPIPMFARFDPANADPTNPSSPLPDVFLRPYLGYQDINLRQNGVTSNYNSFQLSANRRFIRGLQFGLAYTWSKALGVADGDTSGVSPYFDLRRWNYGPLGFDRRHIAVVNYIYEVPKIGNRMGFKAAEWIFDNWQVSGITSFTSGGLFTPGFSTTDGQDITGSSEGARIVVLGDPYLPKSERAFERNFRTEMFGRPARGTFGNAGVRILTGPGTNNWDVAVSKRIPLGDESRYLQFRGEFFNVWNHTQFSSVDSTARFNPAGQQVNLNFGAFTGARDPRTIQFSLRLNF